VKEVKDADKEPKREGWTGSERDCALARSEVREVERRRRVL
jgi:hypothetical protein